MITVTVGQLKQLSTEQTFFVTIFLNLEAKSKQPCASFIEAFLQELTQYKTSVNNHVGCVRIQICYCSSHSHSEVDVNRNGYFCEYM